MSQILYKLASENTAPDADDNCAQLPATLEARYEKYRSLDEGKAADYIPELARADPGWFGIAVATTDGEVFECGDSMQSFTIQFISKAFVYGLHAWLTDAVDVKLAQRGFSLGREAPDFLVSYDAPLGKRGLSLVFALADSPRSIWRGTAHDKAYPARNADAQEQRIRTAVGRLLEQFPLQHGQ